MKKANYLVIASRNKGKTDEIRELLSGFPITIKSLDDFGPIPEVEEDGETFDENAYKKASFTARVLGHPALADDSGLVVDALDGAPVCSPHAMRVLMPQTNNVFKNCFEKWKVSAIGKLPLNV